MADDDVIHLQDHRLNYYSLLYNNSFEKTIINLRRLDVIIHTYSYNGIVKTGFDAKLNIP